MVIILKENGLTINEKVKEVIFTAQKIKSLLGNGLMINQKQEFIRK